MWNLTGLGSVKQPIINVSNMGLEYDNLDSNTFFSTTYPKKFSFAEPDFSDI